MALIAKTNRWWARHWDTRDEDFFAIDCSTKLHEIASAKENVNDPQYFTAVATLHRQKYVGEIMLNEANAAIPDSEVERIFALEMPPTERMELKVYNLKKAIDYLLPIEESVICSPTSTWLAVEKIKDLHQIVMAGLLDHAGSFRCSEASPAGYSMYYYKSPTKIEPALEMLCRKTIKRMEEAQKLEAYSPDHVKELTSIAANFLGTFLDIHPFSNGNGRTCRLLMSCILSSICIVPISLNLSTSKPCREVYLTILSDARLSSVHDYSTLHSFVLEAVHRNISQLHWWQSP